jgi:uncharacterized membrane protein
MKLLRFALVALCVIGVAVCLHALGVLAGAFPVGKLPPYPAWTAVHFASGIVFAMLAPLQLWPVVRRRSLRLHRIVGRTAVATGAVLAVSGVAIAYLAPERPMAERIFMTTFFAIYAGVLALGFRAALARDLAAHRAWMIRMTAVALTPVTQRVVFVAFAATLGVHGLDGFWQLFTSAAWIAFGLNVAGAEAWLRGRATVPERHAQALAV